MEYRGKLAKKEKKFALKGTRFALIVSRFNQPITDSLLQGARHALEKYEVDEENITIFWVPGALEIPLIAKKAAASQQFDAIICLGAVIKGETAHFEYVSSVSASGIADVSLEYSLPVINAILTVYSAEQARARTAPDSTNKGYQAAEVALEMANLLEQLSDTKVFI